MKKLFLDLETPNKRNNRPCQIGLIYEVDDSVVFEKNIMINPEAPFDDYNIDIHHITPDMVSEAPNFPEVWEKLRPYFSESLIVGHNVRFDLSVLSKSIHDYGLEPLDVMYEDTMIKAHSLELPGKLDELNIYLKLPDFSHHDAMEDIRATRLIYHKLYELSPWKEHDGVKELGFDESKTDAADLERKVNELYGIFAGIGIDKEINAKEIDAIRKWIAANQQSKNQAEFKDIFEALYNILEDNKITLDEYKYMLVLLDRFHIHRFSRQTVAMQRLKGILIGIIEDKKIREAELENLKIWMMAFDDLIGHYPFNKIVSLVEDVMADNVVTEEENTRLIEEFRKFISPVEEQSTDHQSEDIDLSGKSCCLTGNFTLGTKKDIEQRLTAMGAAVVPSVTKKTDVLIAGGQGSTAWAYGNYGGKKKRLLKCRKKVQI